MNENSGTSFKTTATESVNTAISSNTISKLKENNEDIDVLGLLRTLWRGKWVVAFFAVLMACVAVAYLVYLAVPTYKATAVVALDSREAQVVDIESVVSNIGGDQASVNTEVEVLKSRTLLGSVVDELKLVESPEFNLALRPPSTVSLETLTNFVTEMVTGQPVVEEVPTIEEQRNGTIDEVAKIVAISNVRNSYVFMIDVVTESPELSRDLANVMADLYLESQLEAKFDATQRATKWLTERVSELQIALEESEQSVKEFSAQTDLIGPEALEALERQVKDMRDRAVDADVAAKVLESKFADLANATTPKAIVTASQDSTLRRLLENDQGESPAFQARKERVLSSAQSDLARAQSRALALKASVVELEKDTAEQAQDFIELRQLEREAEASRLIYEFFLTRLKETSVQQGIQQADARILSFAVAPQLAATPRKGSTLIMLTMLGVFLGSGLVLLREITQSTYRTSDALELDTGYSVIGQIPMFPVKKREKLIDYLYNKPTSAAVEAIRNLRTTILLQDLDNPPKVVVSTSSMPSEGKTTQSVGLALNMASMGRKVLLIEGDIRRRVFGSYFDIKETVGLVSVLGGQTSFESAVHHNKKYGFDVLQGESSKVNAADLYSSDKFRTFLEQMRAEYDFIVIDTPPVLLVPDARIIAGKADAVIYAVRWDVTPKTQVRRGIKLFESVGISINGLVLSQVDAKGLKGYGYGDYGNAAYYEN